MQKAKQLEETEGEMHLTNGLGTTISVVSRPNNSVRCVLSLTWRKINNNWLALLLCVKEAFW